MQAALRLSEILLEHDRAVNRKEIAQERAAVRLAEAQSQPVEPDPLEQPARTQADALHEAQEFLRKRGIDVSE